MKNIIFNLKELFGYSNLAVNPDGQTTVKRRSKITYICCLFAFLTLGVGQAWGYEFTGGYIYFDNSVANQSGVIQLCARQGSYTAVTTLNNIENTKLYYNGSCTGTDWGGYSGIFIIANDAAWNNGNFAETNGSLRWHTAWEGSYECKSGNTTLFAPTSSSNGTAANPSYIGNSATSYTSLNYTQTIKSQVSTDGGSTYSDANSKATISVTSYKLTGNGVVTQQTTSVSTSAKSTTVSAARTATTTVSIGAVATGFTFVGWYDGSTQVSTESSYTYYPTAAKTITAKFKNETTYTITIANSVNATTSTVNVGATPVQITAPEIAGYRFSTWNTMPSGVTKTSGNLTDQSIYISATQAATVTATYVAKTPVRLYFSNPDGWATVKAYVWKDATTVTDKNNEWPGVTITTNTVVNNCNTFYYYEYYKEDHPDWNRVIFNDGGSNKTGDITFSNTTNNGQYYVGSSWTSTPGSRWALAHSIDSYNTTSHRLTCADATSGYVDVVLEGNTDYQFKFVDTYTNTWYGVTSPTKITYTNKGTARTMNNTGSSSNQTMTSAGAGTYRFTWNITNKKVTITYPTSYTVEFEVGTVKGNVNNPIIYHTSVDNANKVTSGKYVAEGTKVIFWIANSKETAPKAGYNWWGFYNNAAGTGSDLPEKYTNNTVSVYTINSISANAHVYAVFGENDYTVKMYNNGNGDVYEGGSIVTSTTAHVATASNTLTATPQTGYYFTGWDQFSDSLTINSPSTASTTIKIKSNKLGNNARLRANYSPQWSVIGTGAFGGWSAYGSHLFTGYTVVSTKNVGYHSITLAANTSYEIKVYDRQNSTAYGGSAAQTIDYAHSGAGNQYTVATTASPKNVVIQSAAGGTYTLNWNLTDKKIAVVYPTSWFITSGQKTEGQSDEAGGSFTAVDNSSNDVKGGKFVADNASVTFSATPNTGYDFDGWYTNAGCTEGKNSTNPMTVSSITANKTIYAKFVPKTYTVTLTQTGAASAGTASVTASYNADAPTIATLPTAANGYAFMGYYSETDGEGTQFVQANGTWNDVTSYISGGKWIYDDDVTLYAYFKKAEITAITLNSSVLDPVDAGGTGWVIANPTVEPAPAGSTKICWELLYDNDNPVPAGHEAQAYAEEGKPNQVRFSIAGLAASRYKIKATLRTGSSCDGGTELSTFTQTFTIASSFTVTILYQDDDNNNIAPGTTSPGKATDWTTISAPDIFGYSFVGWTLGEGITTEDPTDQQNDFRFKASYYGTITAKYEKNQYIYLDLSQTFSASGKWDNPYVYFYNGDPWDNTNGAGATGHSHYISGHAMTKIDGTDIWYFDYSAVSNPSEYIAFTWGNQTSQANFWKKDVIFRGDFSESTPLFVPATDGTTESRKTVVNEAQYYNKGYWVTYLGEATGYTLLVYNSAGDVELKREPFIAADKRMTMTSTVQLDASSTYKIEVLRNDGYWYKAASNFTASSLGAKPILPDGTKNAIQTNADGIYTFTLGYLSGNLQLSVVYPSSIGDFRIAYTDNATWSHSHTLESWILPSKTITHRANGIDTVSFFISKGAGITPKIRWQKVTGVSTSSVTWGTTVGTNCSAWLTTGYTDVDEAGVYNFKVTQNADGTSIASIERIGKYDGSYYIRCNALRSKWDHYTIDSDHRMTYSEFSESAANSFGEKYSHYKAKWCPRNTNIAFVIANDYSPCLTDKLTTDVGGPDFNNLEADGTLKYEKTGGGGMMYNDANAYLDKYSANVRFMWNRKTNKISRAYVSAATSNNAKFLVLQGSGTTNSNIYNGSTGDAFTVNPPGANSVILKDDQNWIYEVVIKANPSALVKLYANYCDQIQWFRGAAGTPFNTSNAVELLGGEAAATQYSVRVIYDFKTNRLVCAWMPEGASQEISTDLTVNADVMVIREHQGSAQCITFANDKSMTGVKTVYGAMKFNRWILSNRAHPEDTNPDHCRESNIGNDLGIYHPVLPIDQQLSIYERSLYFISFPFDVKASEIFGFGHYWDEWYLEYYDGETRAKNGYWKDSPANWKYVTPDMLEDFTLKANEGYILGLDLDFMKVDNTTFWSNGISTVELYFPSTVNLETLQQTNVTIPALSSDYKCTINRGTPEGDRRVKDSYWRCLGVPSFNIYNSALKDSEGKPITWKTDYTWHADESEFPFIYMWNKADNTLTAQATSAFNFLPMHAYLVQNGGEIKWTAVSAKPSSIVARKENDMPATTYEWRLTLNQDSNMVDQTFVRMTNLEQVTDTFDFGQDLVKELNTGRSDIYTYIGYERVAANSRPIANTQTVIPMGLNIESAGDYTFAIPEGTDGIGVTLIDEETGIRTSLGALSYTVNLPKGNYDNRFVLEISPIKTITTGIDEVPSNQGPSTNARKVMIDGILYIVKDGKMHDSRGTLVR